MTGTFNSKETKNGINKPQKARLSKMSHLWQLATKSSKFRRVFQVFYNLLQFCLGLITTFHIIEGLDVLRQNTGKTQPWASQPPHVPFSLQIKKQSTSRGDSHERSNLAPRPLHCSKVNEISKLNQTNLRNLVMFNSASIMFTFSGIFSLLNSFGAYKLLPLIPEADPTPATPLTYLRIAAAPTTLPGSYTPWISLNGHKQPVDA